VNERKTKYMKCGRRAKKKGNKWNLKRFQSFISLDSVANQNNEIE
jgi:hypothetical protein